jgi:hypothetical protein
MLNSDSASAKVVSAEHTSHHDYESGLNEIELNMNFYRYECEKPYFDWIELRIPKPLELLEHPALRQILTSEEMTISSEYARAGRRGNSSA